MKTFYRHIRHTAKINLDFALRCLQLGFPFQFVFSYNSHTKIFKFLMQKNWIYTHIAIKLSVLSLTSGQKDFT